MISSRYTYGLYITVDRATDDALNAGTITPATAQTIQAKLLQAHPLLDAAQQTVVAGATPTADTLSIVAAIQQQLLALQSQLQSEAPQ